MKQTRRSGLLTRTKRRQPQPRNPRLRRRRRARRETRERKGYDLLVALKIQQAWDLSFSLIHDSELDAASMPLGSLQKPYLR